MPDDQSDLPIAGGGRTTRIRHVTKRSYGRRAVAEKPNCRRVSVGEKEPERLFRGPAPKVVCLPPGLDHSDVGPEHSWLKERGRLEYVSATDDEAVEAFHQLVMNLCGRGDKDLAQIVALASWTACSLPRPDQIIFCAVLPAAVRGNRASASCTFLT
jgi:hypothetical protein